MQAITLSVNPHYQLPSWLFPVEQPRIQLLLMAALGVGARFYWPLAQALATHDIQVLLLEQRGHGESGLLASRRSNWGFAAALQEDIPAALDFLQLRHEAPVYCMGHSLGGHYAAMAAGLYPNRIAGVVIAACGSPWYPAFEPPVSNQIRWLCRAIPALTTVLGFYPGNQLRFGGREAAQLMRDWALLAKTNRYAGRDLPADIDQRIGRFGGPLLSVRMDNDSYAPERAMAAVSDKFTASKVTKVLLSEQDIGDRADHFRWARKPAAVADAVAVWLQQLGR